MVSFDRVFDAVFLEMGIEPQEIENFLFSNRTGTRIAANAISISRVGLGYLAIKYYEAARERGNKKKMMLGIISLAAILATDSIDGYLCRKAHIENSERGRIIDSVCDVALRLLIARSSILSKRDWIGDIRVVAELAVGYRVIPDIITGTYSSTDIGKVKVVCDALAIISSMISDVDSNRTPSNFRFISLRARFLSAILAVTDAVGRSRSREKE